MAENPKHDYGYSLMALAETLTALGETDAAMEMWKQVTENHSYPRAKVQLAELYMAKNQRDLARSEVNEVVADDVHAPAFQRKRDRVWVRRAKGLYAEALRKARVPVGRQREVAAALDLSIRAAHLSWRSRPISLMVRPL